MEKLPDYNNCEECGEPLVLPEERLLGYCYQCQDIEDQGE